MLLVKQVPALLSASMVLPVPEWPGGTASGALLWLPHIRDASGLKERKRRVKAHKAIRERSSIPPAAFSALDIGCEEKEGEKRYRNHHHVGVTPSGTRHDQHLSKIIDYLLSKAEMIFWTEHFPRRTPKAFQT